MERKIKRKDLITQRRKRQIVQNWLSSFVVTTVVVVAAVTLPSKLPEDSTLKLISVGTDIYYETFVEYSQEEYETEEHTEEVYPEEHYEEFENKLTIVAKSNLDQQTQELYYGQSNGTFSNLLPNTLYTVSIYYKGQFAPVSIAKQSIKTKNTLEGQIISAQLVDDEYFEQQYCEAQIVYSNPNNSLVDITLNATYYVQDEYEPYEYNLEPIQVTETNFYAYLPYLPYTPGRLTLTLTATYETEEVVVLNEKIINSKILD